MYKRFMIGVVTDPVLGILCVTLTGFEEAVVRSTMCDRDRFWRWLFGGGDYTEEELEVQKRIWSVTTFISM